MDRRDFMKTIMVNDYEEYVLRSFDEIMALYDLLGEYNNITISSNHGDPDFIKFDVLLPSIDKAIQLKQVVDLTKLTVYNKTYDIFTTIDSNILSIQLRVTV